MSTSSTPIRNTTEARTQFGRYWSGLVRKRRTIRTTPAVVRQASCVRPPALSAICGLRRAAVDDERAGEPGADVRHPEADHVHVLVEVLLVARRVRARGGRALREDDDEDRDRGGDELRDVAERDARPADVRAGRPAPSPRSETPCEARSKPQLTAIEPTTAISAPGIFLLDEPQADDRGDHATRDEDGRAARVGDVPERGEELADRAAVAVGDAEHPRDLAHRHLDADAGQEADEHRAREEVGDEAEPQQPREDAGSRP